MAKTTNAATEAAVENTTTEKAVENTTTEKAIATTTAEKAVATPAKEKMVTIKLYKDRTKKDDVFVSVNGRNFQIERGKEVEVPECVAEVLKHSQKMDELAIERSQQIAEKE